MGVLANGLATGFGAGLAPKAPGTLGALEGVGLYLIFVFLERTPLQSVISPLWLLAVANLALFAVGVWAAARVCTSTGLADPQKVVIDEVSGQLIALSPLAAAPSIAGLIVAFALFRLFDIFKPYPISRLEQLHGGLGVMADDALAGIFAAVLVGVGRFAALI
jgi:phosphatidylglycerophosphatase A